MHNSLGLMKFCRALSPVRIFHPVYIHLSDLDIVVEFDYVNAIFRVSEKSAQLSMCSESLWFIFKNTYGFNTLTVNGCFEEVQLKGFVAATKTLAIENLNNLGVYFKWTILFNPALIALCFKRLWIVSKKLMLKK